MLAPTTHQTEDCSHATTLLNILRGNDELEQVPFVFI